MECAYSNWPWLPTEISLGQTGRDEKFLALENSSLSFTPFCANLCIWGYKLEKKPIYLSPFTHFRYQIIYWSEQFLHLAQKIKSLLKYCPLLQGGLCPLFFCPNQSSLALLVCFFYETTNSTNQNLDTNISLDHILMLKGFVWAPFILLACIDVVWYFFTPYVWLWGKLNKHSLLNSLREDT